MARSPYRLRRVADTHPDLAWLDAEVFQEDQGYPIAGSTWWVVRHQGTQDPVGFAGLKYYPTDHCGYLCRAGVTQAHRGHGLQRRLIVARVRYAQDMGWRGVYTYTLPHNHTSGNNLISCGFRLFSPDHAWAGDDVCYWWLGLSKTPNHGGESPT